MCGGKVGSGSSGAGEIMRKAAMEAAKNAGTGPTPIEKKIYDAAEKAIVETVKDGVKFVTSPEGTAITGGLLIKAFAPTSMIGDAFVLGGLACAAIKHLEKNNNKPVVEGLTKDVVMGTAGAIITPVAPFLGIGMMAIASFDAGVNIGKAIDKAVSSEVKHAGKAIAKGAALGAVGHAAKKAETETLGMKIGKAAADVVANPKDPKVK